MSKQTANIHIDNYTRTTNLKTFKSAGQIVFICFFMCACFLITLRHFVLTGGLLVASVAEYVYITIMRKNNIVTTYTGISINLIVVFNITLLFNVCIYSIQNILHSYDPLMFIIIIMLEVLCMITGFAYVKHCVECERMHKKYVLPLSAVCYSLFGVTGYHLAINLINGASVRVQSAIFTILFAVGGAVMASVIGAGYISSIYFIIKYSLPSRSITSEKH